MRTIKSFNNHQEYIEFYNDEKNFIRANVCYCENEDEIHYNPLLKQNVVFENLKTTITVDETISTNVATNKSEGGGAITYSVSDPSVATVDADSGEVKGIIGGSVTITAVAEATDKYRAGSATYELLVEKLEQVVTITNPTGGSVEMGAEYAISASTDGDGTLSYASSDESIATVDENGNVSGVAEGEVVITVTASETDRCKESEGATYALKVYASNGYFTIVPKTNCTIKFSNSGMQYSKNNGATWSTITNPSQGISGGVGDKVMFKSTITPSSSNGIGSFRNTTGSFDVEGNAMSLLYGDDFKDKVDIKSYAFYDLLKGTQVVSAENLILPSTSLKEGCYKEMFENCTKLEKAPVLPATTLAQHCYNTMFANCTSLAIAPELPATTLAYGSYLSMFQYCTKLEKAPDITASTLADYSCPQMFNGCEKLNYIKCLATTWNRSESIMDLSGSLIWWTTGVASTGTFVKKAGVSWPRNDCGIPAGWTVVEEA